MKSLYLVGCVFCGWSFIQQKKHIHTHIMNTKHTAKKTYKFKDTINHRKCSYKRANSKDTRFNQSKGWLNWCSLFISVFIDVCDESFI